jgi:hypothetical protein
MNVGGLGLPYRIGEHRRLGIAAAMEAGGCSYCRSEGGFIIA